MANEKILQVVDLCKSFHKLDVLKHISVDFEKNEVVSIIGPSGGGKSTFLRCLNLLEKPSGGQIFFEGEDITNISRREMQKYRTDIQLIFQDPYSSLPPRMTVGNIIAEAVRIHNIVPKEEVHGYVLDIMKKCGLQPQHYDRYPHEFSGGQRQRINVARALAMNPKVIVCDEPVSALDVSIQAQVLNLFNRLQQQYNLTYVFISHDLGVIKHVSDRIAIMYLGRIVELCEADAIYENPLHPYTKALLSASARTRAENGK